MKTDYNHLAAKKEDIIIPILWRSSVANLTELGQVVNPQDGEARYVEDLKVLKQYWKEDGAWHTISHTPAVVGDMQKSTYDTDDDGIVDEAEKLNDGSIEVLPSEIPKKATADITYYISPTGSDETGDGSSENPFATIQHAIDLLPRHLNGFIAEILLKDGTYNESVVIAGIVGGEIWIYSESYNPDTVIVNGISGKHTFDFLGTNFYIDSISIRVNGNYKSCVHAEYCHGDFYSVKVGCTEGNINTVGIGFYDSSISVYNFQDIDTNKVKYGVELNFGLLSIHGVVSAGENLYHNVSGLVVDGVNLFKADYDDAISKKHEHSNKTELDLVTDGDHDVRTDNPHDVLAEQVSLSKIGTPTIDSIQEAMSAMWSSGKISGGNIIDNEDGTVTVASGSGFIKATDSDTAEIKSFEWAENDSVSLVNNAINYIYVEYNSESPRVVASTSLPSDKNTNIPLGLVYREDTDLYITTAGQVVSNYAKNTLWKDIEVNGKFQRVSGLKISETGTRNIAITAGEEYAGLTKVSIQAFDSSGSDEFTYYYRDGAGGWTKITGQTQIDNTHYDDGSGTLATLSDPLGWRKYYGVHWVYEDINGNVYVIYGQGDYLLTDAENAQPPSTIPDLLQGIGRLVGKIIIEKNASSFESVESPFDVEFVPTVISNHNELGGLQGGIADEYYHLTSDEHAAATRDATNEQNGLMPAGVKDGYDDAVTKKHTQNTDQKLDEGGANEVTAAQAKEAYNKRASYISEYKALEFDNM